MSTQVAVIEKFATTLKSERVQQQLAEALPPNISRDRFTRALLTAWQINPGILSCTTTSVFTAVLSAAQQGLMPDGREGAIVAYGDRAQFMPMVAGVIKRFAEAGVSVYAGSVYSKDKFDAWNDDAGQHVEHRPAWFSGDRGEWVGCYAVATVDGRTYVEIADMAELKRIQAASRAGNSGPWKQWPERMGQKSMLHRLGRRVPLPVNSDAAERLARTVNADRDGFDDEPPAPTTVTPTEPAQTARSRPRVFDQVEAATDVPTEPEAAGNAAQGDSEPPAYKDEF